MSILHIQKIMYMSKSDKLKKVNWKVEESHNCSMKRQHSSKIKTSMYTPANKVKTTWGCSWNIQKPKLQPHKCDAPNDNAGDAATIPVKKEEEERRWNAAGISLSRVLQRELQAAVRPHATTHVNWKQEPKRESNGNLQNAATPN